jgi:N-acetyltransferase
MTRFDTKAQHVLENDRVILRPMVEVDLQHLLPYALNEPEIWHYSLQAANSQEKMEKYIRTATEKRVIGDSYPFIVLDKLTTQYAGSTRFYDIQEIHDTVQIGYTWYGKAFQRTGLNWNCKFLLLQFAFDVLGMHRVEFRADALNSRSIKAMIGIGCTKDGILRQNVSTDSGLRRDSIVLSILKDEWTTSIKSELFERL